mgnify:CR=1 FL=1
MSRELALLTELENRADAGLVQFDSRRPYREYDPERIVSGSTISPKLDGVYARVSEDGVTSRSGKPLAGQERARRTVSKKNPGRSIEGELYHRDGFERTLSDVKAGRPVDFRPFPNQGAKRGPGVRPIRGKRIRNERGVDREYRRALRRGNEGVVIEDPSGARMKRKPLDDSEFRVSAVRKQVAEIEDGDHRSTVRVPPPRQGDTGPAPGDSVTVTHQGRTRSGRLRHPRFKAVRNYE